MIRTLDSGMEIIMALTKKQAEQVMNLFVLSFMGADGEKDRRKIFVDFEDVFGKSISGWQSACTEKLAKAAVGADVAGEFERLARRHEEGARLAGLTVRAMEKTDWPAVRQMINKEFDRGLTIYDEDRLNHYLDGGYSLVACSGDEVLGALLGFRIPDMNMDAVYIDTLVVGETVRGCGIGKLLLKRISKKASDDEIFTLRLQTNPAIEAYQIYRHLGFEEIELVQMKKYVD
jgi:GNAT superfamily N-acetyltransferase